MLSCTSVKRHDISDTGNGDSFVVENQVVVASSRVEVLLQSRFSNGRQRMVRTFSVSLCLIPSSSGFFLQGGLTSSGFRNV